MIWTNGGGSVANYMPPEAVRMWRAFMLPRAGVVRKCFRDR